MTTTADHIRDAADPLAEALAAVQGLGVRVPPVDVLIAYTAHGCVVRVAERSAAHRADIEAAFSSAFGAAGWGVAVRATGGLSMGHPMTMTRLTVAPKGRYRTY
ncbi:hypothetical protein AB0F39_34515 [Streptomyces murinus]|uniref:hypothetical protein n=1 Tax=Streptomyces murinus TaxID=33900 RepID=UPI0033D01EFF